MPPVRTLSVPPKPPMKTERTHEENQERAYIAASRRSDRSLEARVESARRASEIHKRRTGRGLRVTEQDVVNEEMYEEEDEDLPMQYRRLTAHLNSGSSGLNKRLAAYLTNHIAMRSALGQAISNSEQQFPRPTNFASMQQQPWAQSPLQMSSGSPSMPPNMIQRQSASYRQSPYPMSPSQPFYPPFDQRSPQTSPNLEATGIHTSDSTQLDSSAQKHERRASEPVQPSLPRAQRPAMPSADPSSKAASASPTGQTMAMSNAPSSEAGAKSSDVNPQYPPQAWSNAPSDRLGPLSTAMPREIQMYPGYGFDPSDPFGMNAAGGNSKNEQPFQMFGPSDFSKTSMFHPSFEGMSQTLAPSALDTNPNLGSFQDYSGMSGEGEDQSYSLPSFENDFDQSYSDNFGDSGGGSGRMSPSGDKDWDAFIDQTSWD